MKKVLVTGAHGMLGTYICSLLTTRYLVFPHSHHDFDITLQEQVNSIFAKIKPDIVFHLAALTNVDFCERNEQKAYLINGYALESIVENCNKHHSKLVYISSGMIFGGKKNNYSEKDLPDSFRDAPVNIYGKSKLLGEQIIQRSAADYLIIRTSWLFGGKKADKKFVGKMIEWGSKGEIEIVNDTWGSPTYTFDLAKTILRIIETNSNSGMYHITNQGYCNRVEFAKTIFEYANIHCKIKEISAKEYQKKQKCAPRPKYEVLASNIVGNTRSWQKALKEYIETELSNENKYYQD